MRTTIITIGKKAAVRIRQHLAFFVLISTLLVGFGLSIWLNIGALVTDQSTKQPDHYSELFFDNPTNLPKLLANTENNVPFTITNVTGTWQSYTYRVTLSENNGAQTSYERSLALANGEASKQLAAVTPTSPRSAKTLTIDLLNTEQQIQFRSYP